MRHSIVVEETDAIIAKHYPWAVRKGIEQMASKPKPWDKPDVMARKCDYCKT